MIASEMNTARMTEFPAQVSAAHRCEFIIMVVDGASSHGSKDLAVPKNMGLPRLPPCAPELNPQENVGDELREKEFPNRVYADMASVHSQLEVDPPRLAADRKAPRSLTAWPWIDSLILNAHKNSSHITRNWRGRPQEILEVVVNFIAGTTARRACECVRHATLTSIRRESKWTMPRWSP